MQEDLTRYKKESEKKYNELKEENLKMKEEIEKLKIEKAISLSKTEISVNIKKKKENHKGTGSIWGESLYNKRRHK